jgi:hypothetical protein
MRNDIEPNDIDRDGDIMYNFKEEETVWLDRGQVNEKQVTILEFLEDYYCRVTWYNDSIDVHVLRLSKS